MTTRPETPVVLVTGASSGIGLALAHRLWKSRYRAVLTARRPSLEKLASAGFADTDQCLVRPLDVTVAQEREQLIAEIEARWNGVQVLINNAAISYRSVIEHLTEEEELDQLRTNYFGPLALTRLVLPGMRRRRWGRIINISSVGGMMAMPTMGAYSASKFALEGASEALWYEVRPWNIKVTLVQPGFIHSHSFTRVRWSHLAKKSVEADDEYAIYYRQMSAFIERLMRTAFSTSDRIAARIIQTMEMEAPPLRLPATLDAHFFALLRRLLPRRIYHWVLHKNLPGIEQWGRP